MLRHGNIFCKGTHFFRSKSQVAPFFFSPMAGGGKDRFVFLTIFLAKGQMLMDFFVILQNEQSTKENYPIEL